MFLKPFFIRNLKVLGPILPCTNVFSSFKLSGLPQHDMLTRPNHLYVYNSFPSSFIMKTTLTSIVDVKKVNNKLEESRPNNNLTVMENKMCLPTFDIFYVINFLHTFTIRMSNFFLL